MDRSPLRLTLGPSPSSGLVFPIPSLNPFATIWIPAYGGIRGETVCCLIAEMSKWGGRVWFSTQDKEDHIGLSRSKEASRFLAAPRERVGDVLLMVDNDIIWQVGDLAYIARKSLEKKAIIGGVYPKRAFGQGIPYRWKETGEFKIGDDRLVEAEFVSSGFMAIPRSILEAIKHKVEWIVEGTDPGGYYGFFLPHVHTTSFGRELLSEDWELCNTASEAGFKNYLALKPRLEHEGWQKFRLMDAYYSLPPQEDIVISIVEGPVSPLQAILVEKDSVGVT